MSIKSSSAITHVNERPFLSSHKKEIILVALTLIALGGAIMNALGFFGYLPNQTVWIGGVIDIAAIIAIAVTCVLRKISKQAHHSDATSNVRQTPRQHLSSEGLSNHLDGNGLKTNPGTHLNEVIANPELGTKFMASPKGQEIDHGKIRLQIFRAAFESLLDALRNRTLSQEEIHACFHFLWEVRCEISQDDYSKIVQLRQCLFEIGKEHLDKVQDGQQYFNYVNHIEIVLGKLFFQLPVEGDKTFQFSEDITHLEFYKICAVRRKLLATSLTSQLRCVLFYLSLIPACDAHFPAAQNKMIEIWEGSNNLPAAGECLLTLAEMHPGTEPSVELAASYLLAKLRIKGGITWKYILREDFERYRDQGQEVSLLGDLDLEELSLKDLSNIFYRLKRDMSLKTIESLLNLSKDCYIFEAWMEYCEIAYIPALDGNTSKKMSDRGYSYKILPPENLLKGMKEMLVKEGKNLEEIVGREFLEDCAKAYPDLFQDNPSINPSKT